jgi:hypothetical protein
VCVVDSFTVNNTHKKYPKERMDEMNDNFSSSHISDRREARRQRRSERHGYEWVGGVILIVIAVILIMRNLNMVTFTNWWAFFILIPALGSFETARQMYQQDGGRFTTRSRGSAFVGGILLVVTVTFLLNLNWVIVGPALLLLGGLGVLVNSLLPNG